MNIVIIDFEIFEHLWMLGWKYHGSNETHQIINDRNALNEFLKVHTKQNTILVGHNIDGYDDYILRGLMDGMDSFELVALSDSIIESHKRVGKNSGYITYDTMNQPVIALAQMFSLKTIALFFGHAGYECSVPFDLDRPLTPDEIHDVCVYNDIDLHICDRVFEFHKNNTFLTKIQYCNTFGLPINNIKYTWGTLAAKRTEFVKGVKFNENDIEYSFPKTLRLSRYQDLLNKIPLKGKVTGKNIKYEVAGLTHLLGEGGEHAALKQYHTTDVWVADVTSYYPTMMHLYRDMQSRTIKNKDLIGETLQERVRLKRLGDPSQASYKEWLVTMYGITKSKHSPFFDPSSQHKVAISGQLFLLDLNDKLYNKCNDFKLVQGNTDGIFFKCSDINEVKECAKEWEQRTGFNLEYDHYDILFQKDVNNYIAFKIDDDFNNGIITHNNFKGKGSYAIKYFPTGTGVGESVEYYKVNNRWLSVGIVRLLAFDKLDISDLDAIDLQIIIEAVNYKCLTLNGENVGRAVRTYPVLDGYGGGQLYRHKMALDKSSNEYTPVDTKVGPSNALVYKEQVLDVPESFYDMLDYDYYYDMIINKAIDFGYKGKFAVDYIYNEITSVEHTKSQITKILKRIGCTSIEELCDWRR